MVTADVIKKQTRLKAFFQKSSDQVFGQAFFSPGAVQLLKCFAVKINTPSVEGSYYTFSLFLQYNLVCANAWMLDLTQAILNLGFLTGAFTLGYAADR